MPNNPAAIGTRVYAYKAVGTIKAWKFENNEWYFQAEWADGKFAEEWYRWHPTWLKP